MTEAEAKMATEAILSGWITTGPKTKEFEKRISAYVHTDKTACLNSATACMEMVLRLLGLGPDDEVIVPAYTYTASASTTQHVGCRLVMVDSQNDSTEMDYDKLAEAITERTKATVPAIAGETWNEFLYRKCMLFSLHGQNKDALAKTKLGAWEYDVIGPWYKCNMTDITAGIGLAQLDRYDDLLKRRQEIVAQYDAGLKGCHVALMNHKGADHCSSHHLYLVRLLGKTREQTNEVITKMAERGIACNVHYKPLPMMTAYKALGFDIKDYPNAYRLFENEITLPLHTRLSDEDVQYIIENFVEVMNG